MWWRRVCGRRRRDARAAVTPARGADSAVRYIFSRTPRFSSRRRPPTKETRTRASPNLVMPAIALAVIVALFAFATVSADVFPVASVSPASIPSDGGVRVTLDLASPLPAETRADQVLVTVAGLGCSAVVVGSPSSLSCLAPPGTGTRNLVIVCVDCPVDPDSPFAALETMFSGRPLLQWPFEGTSPRRARAPLCACSQFLQREAVSARATSVSRQ